MKETQWIFVLSDWHSYKSNTSVPGIHVEPRLVVSGHILSHICQSNHRLTVQTVTNLPPGCILPTPTACNHMQLNIASFYGNVKTFEDICIHS